MTESNSIGPLLEQLADLGGSEDYEAVRDGLSQVIAFLEKPGLGLNDSVRAYEVGRTLAEQCQKLLDTAELRITELDGGNRDSGTGSLASRVRLDS